MPVYRVKPRKTVVISRAVASVDGKKPLVGFVKEIEAKWKKLKLKFGIKERKDRMVKKSLSFSEVDKEIDKLKRMTFRRGSDVGDTLSKFKKKEEDVKKASTDDVFHPDWKPPKYDKNAPDYGRPKAGSLTERRGIAAGHHIGKEIITLCEVMTEYGVENGNGTVTVLFGTLFDAYTFISDKVVGMLLRARKHKLVHFTGEMLFQRRDEMVPITLLIPLEQVRAMYDQSDDPAKCLSTSLL